VAFAELLLATRAPPPIARGFARELPERRLRGEAKLRHNRHDRCFGVAQHVHGRLVPVLAQPGTRRKLGAFLEGVAEVEARLLTRSNETELEFWLGRVDRAVK